MTHRTWYAAGHMLLTGAAFAAAALAVLHRYDRHFWPWVIAAIVAFLVADAVCYPRRVAKATPVTPPLPGDDDDGSAERILMRLEAEERASRFARGMEKQIAPVPAGDARRDERSQWPDDVRQVAHVLESGDGDMALIRLIALRHMEKYPPRLVPPCA